jgi:glutathione synthase/RimK-type ligase-like ATP-grasp enzyme
VVAETPKSLSILREACADSDVVFEIVDDFSGFVARLSKGQQSHLVGAAGIGVYPLNRAGPFAIARDKAFTHYVLAKAGFAYPEGEHFFVRPPPLYDLPPGRSRVDALRYAHRLSDGYEKPLVVKPNAGKGAKLVTLVRNEAVLEASLDGIAEVDAIALVQVFVEAPEFRLFLIDGEIAFAYAKERTHIVGDGRSTAQALCEHLAGDDPVRYRELASSRYFMEQLARGGLALASVVPAGTAIPVDFVSNISARGTFAGFVEPHSALRAWARTLAKAVSLRVTGVDLFSPSRLADLGDIIVTDVNGSPNLGTLFDLGHRDLVLDVWRTILRKTFDEPWPEGF